MRAKRFAPRVACALLSRNRGVVPTSEMILSMSAANIPSPTRGIDRTCCTRARVARARAIARDACAHASRPRAARQSRLVGILTACCAVLGSIAALLPATALAQTPTSQALDAAAASAVAVIESLPRAAGARLDVEALPFDPRISIAPCAQPLIAELIGKRLAGSRASVRVRCPDAQNAWSLAVSLRVALFQPVLVARRALVRGDTIDTDNTALAERDVLQLGYGHLDDPARLTGARVRRPIAQGAALVPTAVSPPLLVERDATVTVLARGPAIDVRASGVALDDGSAGERVRVRNISSGRTVSGVVDSAGVVVIER